MSIKRYGVEGGTGTGGQHLPFARRQRADAVRAQREPVVGDRGRLAAQRHLHLGPPGGRGVRRDQRRRRAERDRSHEGLLHRADFSAAAAACAPAPIMEAPQLP